MAPGAHGWRPRPAGAIWENAYGALNRQGQPAIVYFHPWEFDPDHPILRTDVAWLARRTHYHRLALTRSVLAALLNDFTWDPLR